MQLIKLQAPCVTCASISGGNARFSRCIRETLGLKARFADYASKQCLLSRTHAGAHQPACFTNKNGTRLSAIFVFGGAGGNRTRVRKPSTDSSTYLAWLFSLILHAPTDKHLQDELP